MKKAVGGLKHLLAMALPLALAAGCSSYRIHSSLGITKLPVPAPEGARFTLAEVTYTVPTNLVETGFSPFGIYAIDNGTLRTNILKEAMAAYPGVFTDDPGAIPLSVNVTYAGNRMDLVEPYACVSCLTLTILPFHSTDVNDYSVAVSSGKAAADRTLAEPVLFTRTDTGWISILPFGWIPVPAGRGVRAWGTDSAAQKIGAAMTRGVVEAVALRLRQVRPEEWGQ